VEVVRRADDHGIHVTEIEQILDIGHDIGDAEALGEGARLGPVVVAEGDELRATEAR
jgi:hypothetical protein